MIDVYVTGGGVAALAAALDLVEVGLSVRVAVTDAGEELPRGAVRDPEGTIAALLERLASPIGGDRESAERAGRPDAAPRAVPPEAVALPGARGGWQLQPLPAVLGAPAVPLSSECLAILGGGGAFRAYLDRLKPLLTIGKTREFGALVRSRFGRTALDRLVEPLIRERFGVAPEHVDVAVAAPGLNEALSRSGSLSAAVLAYSERHVARETRVIPAGGWGAARDALLERLALYGAQLADARPTAVRLGDDEHRVEEADGGRFETRAVVLDRGRRVDASGPAVSCEGEASEPRLPAAARVRARASVGVEAPVAIPGAARVRTVELPSGERWSVRVSRRGEADWEAELRGPAAPAEAVARQPDPEELAAALTGAGLSPRAGTEWRTRRYAAPHARIEQRDEARAAVDDLDGRFRGSALPVGSSLHGDDLSAALETARAQAVGLRRRLTGIAD
ncbi:hypothetical protein JD276_00415 [Leucobacter sp. CSA1]|uniref:Oxygen-dependent protoporphyrinogen oxidase n=1 Tax=Leucobacter chromiisoli TaxID=2796471 RepID=A0A934Q6I9_9MICO|nr:hypothetical protein [Leucobacter chromiisoli]MBK0417502.1 hypothetical protein [Leucobacter chromiisoli]